MYSLYDSCLCCCFRNSALATLPRNRSSFFHCCLCPRRGPVPGFCASMSPRGKATVNCLSLLQNPSSGLLCAHSRCYSLKQCLPQTRQGWAKPGLGPWLQGFLPVTHPEEPLGPGTDPCHGIPTSRWKVNGLQQLNRPVNLGNVVTFGLDLLVWRK